MKTHPTPRASRARCVALAALVLACLAGSADAAVHFAVTPATQTVTPGSDVDLELTITAAGSNFNGFDVTVSYDPAALTLVPTAPTSAQQGCLMTGVCSIACGTTFHRFSAAGDSAAISDVLLCNQISLTGPGQVYKLHFTASNTQQVTFVRIRRTTFYNAGVFVTPVTTADAQINISNATAVDPLPAPGVALRIAAEPNPARGAVTFALAGGAGEQRLVIHDLAGRLVRVVEQGWQSEESRRASWDGRDAAGAAVPSGVYLATFVSGGRTAQVRVAMVR